MKKLNIIWQYLNGKKTVIGSSLLLIADFLPSGSKMQALCRFLGTVLTGSGLAHKAVKMKYKGSANAEK